MKECLTIRLSKKLARALQADADVSGLSKGEIARQALEARLRRNGRLAVMPRYFGAMTGPADLSTNKSLRRRNGRDLIPVLVPPN
jgi:hypothetical protein